MNSRLGPKLKIGIVSSFMPPHLGGLEVVVENLFQVYRKAGHEVHWVASHDPPQAPRQENGRTRVGCWNWLEGRLGVPWPVWGPASLATLVQLIQWADILHIHDCLYYSSALTVVLSRWLKKPVLLTQHLGAITYPSAILNGVASLAYKTLGRAVLGGVSHVAFCAAATADFCVRLSRGKLKAWSIISPGVDIQRFRPPTSEERRQARLNLGLPTVGTVVLFVGRLHEKKGALVVQELVARYDKLHFLMVGDGPLRPRANKNLTWLPLVPAENMALVYRTADVLLLPSVSESLSLVTLEAMASGVPVIVTRHLPIGDILEDESAGWTAEPTCAGFATCLERVLETPGTKAAVTRRARRLVELHWSNKATERKYLELIKQIATPVPLREALSQKSCGS